MNGKQQTVMWLGLSLVAVRAFSTGQIQALWKTVATPGTVVAPVQPGQKDPCAGMVGLGLKLCREAYPKPAATTTPSVAAPSTGSTASTGNGFNITGIPT